jgi:hypothetical protein
MAIKLGLEVIDSLRGVEVEEGTGEYSALQAAVAETDNNSRSQQATKVADACCNRCLGKRVSQPFRMKHAAIITFLPDLALIVSQPVV